jgi:hypothetical protein
LHIDIPCSFEISYDYPVAFFIGKITDGPIEAHQKFVSKPTDGKQVNNGPQKPGSIPPEVELP